MAHRFNRILYGLCVGALLAGPAAAADGKAVFDKRVALMKDMGKPFYLTLGRAARGSQPIGPDTVAAAETMTALVKDLNPDLFAAGSDVGGSKIKPEIFQAPPDKIAGLIDAVRSAVAQLGPAAQSGDKATLATAFGPASQACAACHKLYRAEE